MKNSCNFKQVILLGAILLLGISISKAEDEKLPGKPILKSLNSPTKGSTLDKDEKLRTASQNLFGYNQGFNNGFNGNGFNSNGFGTGVNNGVYPQGTYASSGLYTGTNYNQNGLPGGYPFGYNGNNVNGFGFQGQGFYPGAQGYPGQGYQGFQQGGGGFNTLGRYPQQFNAFGMPYNTQGAVGVGTYQSAGYPGAGGALYTGAQLADGRTNQYIGSGITVGSNKIDVGGDGRTAGVSSARTGSGRTNPPGFVAGQRQGFGLNYADQQSYNILPGGVFNANNGFGYPGGIQGGIYRQNPAIYNQQFDYNRGFPNSGSGANRYYQGVNPQGSFQQRIHRFVGPDTDRN